MKISSETFDGVSRLCRDLQANAADFIKDWIFHSPLSRLPPPLWLHRFAVGVVAKPEFNCSETCVFSNAGNIVTAFLRYRFPVTADFFNYWIFHGSSASS